MAYQTGTATGVNDLLDKLVTFINANGWTQDSYATEGTGKRYHGHKGTMYVNFRAFNVENAPSSGVLQDGGNVGISSISFNAGTGYSGASAWYNQAGATVNSSGGARSIGINAITGAIPSYHFFAHNSGAQITVVVEYTAGKFQRFGFGTLSKYEAFTGGEYIYASNNGLNNSVSSPAYGFFRGTHNGSETSNMGSVYAAIKVDVDSETGWHFNPQCNYGAARRSLKDLNNIWAYAAGMEVQPNTTNSLAVFFPVIAYINRSTSDTTGTGVSPLGELPKVFYCCIQNFVPGQQITLGSTNYRVFPFWVKGTSVNIPATGVSGDSAFHGFAVEE